VRSLSLVIINYVFSLTNVKFSIKILIGGKSNYEYHILFHTLVSYPSIVHINLMFWDVLQEFGYSMATWGSTNRKKYIYGHFIHTWTPWRVQQAEQDLLTCPGHMSSPPDFNGVRVTRSLVLCVKLCRSLFVLLSFFFCHCVVCPSIYEFCLSVWCLQTLLSWLHFTKRGCGQFWHIQNSLISNPLNISVCINRKSEKMFFVFVS
jgi:hypothetical protein